MTGRLSSPRDLFVLPSPEDLARAAAGRLWGIVRERHAALSRSEKPATPVRVALSGGSTPRRAFEILSAEPYRGGFPWDDVHIYQVDERWVPPDDPMSNRRMLRESLLSRAPIPAENFHPVDTSLPGPGEGARRYEEALRAGFGPLREGAFPRFDAILLGIGKDGHTASLFPGAPEPPPGTWTAVALGGDPPLPRVTLTLPVLCAAARIVFLASGKEKAEALRGVLAGEERWPAARVLPAHGTVTVLSDAEAAGRTAERERGGR